MSWLKKCSLLLLFGLMACRPEMPVPKPYGYFKIDLPEHTYQQFDQKDFPYSFSFPQYAKITRDTNMINEKNEPYWINVYFPDFDATIFLSYKELDTRDNLDDLIEESYRLTFAHDIKADYIKTPPFETKNGLYGISFDVGGNAASSYQFLITDTVKNFVRGALYFNVSPNADSLKPSAEFLKVDIDHMIESFQFK